MSYDNTLIPPREILEIPNSQLPVLLVHAVQVNNLKTCHTLIRGGAVSTRVTLSSGEEPCRLASHSHPERRTVVFESMQEQHSRLAGNHRVSMKSHAFFNCIFQSHILKCFITITKGGGIIMQMYILMGTSNIDTPMFHI